MQFRATNETSIRPREEEEREDDSMAKKIRVRAHTRKSGKQASPKSKGLISRLLK